MDAARSWVLTALALLAAVVVAALVLAPSSPAWVTGPNLVVNGGAESVPTTGWTNVTGTLSRVQYGTGGYPDAIITSGGTFNGGTYLFWGGNTATMIATQTIVLSAADRAAVAAGGVQSDLSAYIGGFASQGDNLTLRAEWRDAAGNPVMTQILDPVTNTERLNRSGFLPRQSVAAIPTTATRVVITITGTRTAGTANDGYIDNISLRLVTGNPPQLSKAFEPSATTPNVPVRMTFTISNPDPQAVNDWTFTDDLPAGLVLATPVNPSTTCPGTTITATGGAQSLLVTGGVAASSTCSIGVDVVSATAGTYVNGASNISAINLARPTTPATLIVAQPDLSITKVASTTQPLIGETFTYTLTVENHGPSSAAGVTVTDALLGSNVELLGATPSQGSCASAEQCQLGTLDDGDIATITVTARATGVGATDNTAIVTSNTGDSDMDNNSDTETVNVQPVADLSITKVASTTQPLIGDTFSYELTVRNDGPSSAAAVTVADVVAGSGVELLSAVPSAGSCSTAGSCQLGTIANGDTVTITVTARALAVGATDNTASVSSSTTDTISTNDSDTETVNVQPVADLSITKVASTTQPLIGDTFTYELTILNNGPSSAAAVTVADVVAGSGVELLSAVPSAGSCSTAGSCQLGTIANGDTVTVTVTARALAVGATDNTASVSSDTEDIISTNDAATETVNVQPVADVSITKVASTTQPLLGATFTYELTVHNNGPSSAAAVTVSDVVAGPGVELLSAIPSAGSCSTASSCQLGNMAYDDTVTITVTARANAVGATDNTASVSSSTTDTISTNDSDTETVTVQPVADLSITKVASTTQPLVGDTFTYELTVHNDGPSSAAAVTVADVVAGSGVELLSAIPSAGSCSTAGSCQLGTIANDDTVTITVTARANAVGATDNTATVSSDTTDTISTNDSDTETVNVQPVADLSITKSATTAQPRLGDLFTYELTVRNNGPSPAAAVAVSDVVAGLGVELVSATPSAGSCSTASSCQLGTMANGDTVTITVTARATAVGATDNTATVSSDTEDINSTNDSDTETVNVQPLADLSITKSALSPTVRLGDQVTYELTVRNNGPSPAENVTVSDTAAAGLAPDSATPSQGACSSASACELGTLAVGQVVTIRVVAGTTAVGTQGNTAEVSSTTAEYDSSNNYDSATVVVEPHANLRIVKTASETTLTEGDDFFYTLTVTNAGPSPAVDTVVTDSIPAGVSVRSVDWSRGSCTQADPVVCQLGDMGVGDTATITIHATATQAGSPVNSAIVSSTTPDPDTDNNRDETQLTTNARSDVSITKTASTHTLLKGESFTYTLKVRNDGPSVATGTVVTDRIPDGLRLDGATSSKGDCAGAPTVVCQLGSLAKGQEETIRLTVTAIDTGTIDNSASVTSEIPDPDPDDNVDDERVEVSTRADMAIEKTASLRTVVAGETVLYGLVVTNNGPSDAANVTVTDPVPAGMRLVSAKPSAGSCNTSGGVIVCDLGEVANGASVTIRVEVVAEQTGTTRNVASVTTSTPDPDPLNDQDETEVTTEERPGVPAESADVSITKAGPRKPVELGGRIVYTLTIRNAGPNDARGVVVTDPIPEAVRVTKATASSGSCATVEGAVVCQLGNLPVGATATVTITARAIRPGRVYNVASVTSSGPSDPDLSNNRDDANARVEPGSAKVSVAKSASRAKAKPGSRVRYRIVVHNRGDRSARNVTVCDRPPAGLAFVSHRGARLRNGAACWTIPLLGPNSSRSFSLTARVLGGPAKRLVNVARVKGTNVKDSGDTAGVRRVGSGGRGGGLTG